jgi:hypothetical protein
MLNLQSYRTATGNILPIEYVSMFSKPDEGFEYWFNNCPKPDDDPDFLGRPWSLPSPNDLDEKVVVDGPGEAPFYNCLPLFLHFYLEATGKDTVKSDDKNCSIVKQRVLDGFVFGEENGDYIYLDVHDNCSVWIYYHDGSDVEKVAISFAEWLARAEEA